MKCGGKAPFFWLSLLPLLFVGTGNDDCSLIFHLGILKTEALVIRVVELEDKGAESLMTGWDRHSEVGLSTV